MDVNKKTKLIGTGAILGTMAVVGGTIAIKKKLKSNRIRKLLEGKQYTTGSIRKFGTLYLDDEKQKLPNDLIDFQDIPIYKGQKIEIRDTDKNDENKLSWVEINDNDKKLLICDRNILKEISWENLNEQNLAFGKVVVIEGKKYLLRLLSGYSENNDYKNNEWDKYIVNFSNIEGLPKCTDYDIAEDVELDSEEKLNGDNNNLWNWYNFSSLTQSEYSKNQKLCIIRGFYSTMYSDQFDKNLKDETVGYRPILELIE